MVVDALKPRQYGPVRAPPPQFGYHIGIEQVHPLTSARAVDAVTCRAAERAGLSGPGRSAIGPSMSAWRRRPDDATAVPAPGQLPRPRVASPLAVPPVG